MTPRSVVCLLLSMAVAGLAGCGGSGSSPVAAPTPTAIPTPTPTPSPSPSPSVPPGGADCQPGGDCSTNKAPVTRAVLRLYRLFDNRGQWFLPTPDPVKQVIQEPIPVGFTLLL